MPLAEKRDEALSMYASSTGDVNTPCMLFEANFDKQYASAKELIDEFRQIYPNTQSNIKDKDIGDFMNRYCQVLKTHKKLSCYSEYKNKELLSADEKVNYNIKYLGCRDKIIAQRKASQEVFETEMPIDIDESALELIRSENVDINYILWLISKGEEKKKIMQKVYCNTRIRSCAPLIDEFIDKWEGTEKREDLSVDKEWKGFISNKQNEELDEIISEFNFKIEERENIKEVLLEEEKDKILQGNWLRNILPHSSYFDTASQEQIKKAKSALLELMNRWEQYRI
ncbi:HsdR family type I site-specific deoxyribonuclease [Mycoplasma wenyonii str. Massachusetts]|uniref:HsdR family type I site-specific deoxyribonuclease n=1 Tax=Mycoplasma wenyonii (strain Massachusetts) TaxID=1197325 RepID=I6ZIC7_MYCWM|nr:HsdR family type I site-specific deoxyribonuclease [Mycoplasma wenyonii]AFN64925.1 HsdR family type I site-specific deoxyribonuclease [Mycoplasma wenyonii str. Massachusetts]